MRTIILSALVAVCLAMGAAADAASVDGLDIYSSSEGTGPAIIFVHGWTCNSAFWEGQVSAFGETHRAITLDLPGHGKTPPPKDGVFSMDLFARAVEAVRAEAGAEKVLLVGHSMGAGVIRKYAIRYPDRVAGLVAVDGPLDMRWAVQQGMEEGRSGERPRMSLEDRKNFIHTMFVEETPDEIKAKVLEMMLQPPESTATGALAAFFDPNNDTANNVIHAPALQIWAGNIPQSELAGRNEKTKEVVPSLQTARVEGTGHFLMMEKPQDCNKRIREFMETIDF